MNNLQRIKSVTANYEHLYGLRTLPAALSMLAFGLLNAFGQWGEAWAWPAFLALCAVSAVAYWKSGSYYKNRFGRTRMSSATQASQRNKFLIYWGIPVGLSALVLWLVLPAMPFGSAMAILCAVSMIAGYQIRGLLLVHHYVCAGILVLVSLLPLTGLELSRDMLPEYLIAGAVFMIIDSVFLHRFLVNTLSPVAKGSKS